jgi:hypothetical protein
VRQGSRHETSITPPASACLQSSSFAVKTKTKETEASTESLRGTKKTCYVTMRAGLLAAVLLAASGSAAGSVATGKEAFFSPLRPVIPTHLPRFAFRSRPGGPRGLAGSARPLDACGGLTARLTLSRSPPLPPHARCGHSRDHAPIRIPLVINIFLVNLDYNSNNVFMALSASDLEEYLMQTFPDLQPSCIETGEQLHVKYDLWYHVAHVDAEHKNMIEHAIRAAMLPSSDDTTEHARSQQPKPDKMKDGGSGAGAGIHYKVPIEGRVMNSLKEVHDIYAPASARRYRFDQGSADDKKPQEGGFFKRGGGSSAEDSEPAVQTYSLFIANIDKTLVAPQHIVEQAESDAETSKSASKRRQAIVKAFTYAYYVDASGGTAADSFIASDRFAVVDLSAGPSQFGSTQAGDGAVIPSSIPRSWFKWGRNLEANSPARTFAFQAQLAQLGALPPPQPPFPSTLPVGESVCAAPEGRQGVRPRARAWAPAPSS